jgi:thioredoxin-like negative regulator of GroEL
MDHFARPSSLLRRLAYLALAMAILVLPATSLADQGDAVHSAAARTAFEEGMKKADAQAWGEAAELFQRALSLRDSPVIRFNLAAALAELGRYVEASETLRGLEIDERAANDVRASSAKDSAQNSHGSRCAWKANRSKCASC